MAPDSDLIQVIAERDEARAQLVELRRDLASLQNELRTRTAAHDQIIQRLWDATERLTSDDEQPAGAPGAPGASRSSYARGLAEGKAMAVARIVIVLGRRPEPLNPPTTQPEETLA